MASGEILRNFINEGLKASEVVLYNVSERGAPCDFSSLILNSLSSQNLQFLDKGPYGNQFAKQRE